MPNVSDRSSRISSWLRYIAGDLYRLDTTNKTWKIYQHHREVVELRDPNGHPVYELYDNLKQRIWDDFKKFSKKFKQQQDAEKTNDKWIKDIKSRKYKEKEEDR